MEQFGGIGAVGAGDAAGVGELSHDFDLEPEGIAGFDAGFGGEELGGGGIEESSCRGVEGLETGNGVDDRQAGSLGKHEVAAFSLGVLGAEGGVSRIGVFSEDSEACGGESGGEKGVELGLDECVQTFDRLFGGERVGMGLEGPGCGF